MRAKPDQAWRAFVDRSRRESLPFEEHLAAFRRMFEGRRSEDGPPAVWTPDAETVRRSNLQASMAAVGIDRYGDFHAWSVRDPTSFWTHTLGRLGIAFTRPPDAILDPDGGVGDPRGGVRVHQSMPRGGVRDPRWMPGAELNIVDSCFTADPDLPAVITPGSDNPDDSDNQALRTMSYGELEGLVNRVANGLCERGLAPGQAIALYMPLNLECVVAYLAIIRAGSWAVSIADSFPASEVRRRMAIAGACCIVTMDRYVRAGKAIGLYDTVVEAGAATVIVVPSDGVGRSSNAARAHDAPSPDDTAVVSSDGCRLRPGDLTWSDLLSGNDTFESVTGDPYRTTNILFSSGTTGEPKAIPWNHLTPIKSAMDGYYHQDIHVDDVTTWPTNIGWMMGPWLIYATLVNGACMALYPDAAHTPEYLRYLRRAGVTVQGVIPSLVRNWRRGGMTEGRPGGMSDGIEWPPIRVFSSTGEPASRTDYLWLMSRTGYQAPVIEYLGGTEIGGGHLACTVLQPCSPAVFTTANLGVDFVILDEAGAEVGDGETGELFLLPPAMGMSQQLLNGSHDEVYYEGCPAGPADEVLRRHGDHAQRLRHGHYRAQGRADDGMNLGGIKVSALELERIIDGHPAVFESAAVAAQPGGDGAEKLVVFIVPEDGSGAAGPHATGSKSGLYQDHDPDTLKTALQAKVSSELNPLFKIHRVVIVNELPHTASGKLVRRALRSVESMRRRSD